MDPIKIIEKYYERGSKLYEILLAHSLAVQQKALSIAKDNKQLTVNQQFIEEASLLHDIGIFLTDATKIHCYGTNPYIAHGYLGADLLRKEGFPQHALVCERHTGCGLSLQMIFDQNLPIPHRAMEPISLEEQIICFADKFYSKTHLNEELPLQKIRKKIAKFGKDSLEKFDNWYFMFNGEKLTPLNY